ncbi:hypothetical protein GGR51DRAFT_554647 [Nemania sp. FL0031]|nr:hypothetical protein GGR51DRAFT_554647 [Nemania sp. FL0031]
MSATGNGFLDLRDLWHEASMQIDVLTHNRAIKLAATTFRKIGLHGQNYFKREASSALNGPAEFYADETDPNRIYLGIGDEFVHRYNLNISQRLGCSLPVLSSSPVPMFTNTTLHQQTLGFSNQQPHSQTGYHGFNYPMPPEAPGYPIQSPGQMVTMPPTPGPSLARKRDFNGQLIENNAPVIAHAQGSINNTGSDEGEQGNEENHIKRPPNAFMFFRQEHAPIVARENPGVHNGEISKLVSTKWRSLTRQEQQPWYDRQAQAAEEHKRLHPGWKFTPGQKKNKRPTKQAKLNTPQAQRPQLPLYPGQPQYMGLPRPLEPLQNPAQPIQQFNMESNQDRESPAVHDHGFAETKQCAGDQMELVPNVSSGSNASQPELDQSGNEQFILDIPPLYLDEEIDEALKNYKASSGNTITDKDNNDPVPIETDLGLREIQPNAPANDSQPNEDQYEEFNFDFLNM